MIVFGVNLHKKRGVGSQCLRGSLVKCWGMFAMVLFLTGITQAAPTWDPAPVGNVLQGNTTVTLDADYELVDVLSGGYGLMIETGGYTLTLTNTSRQQYTGNTTINGTGIVAIKGSKGSGGTGVFGGTVTINSGATLQFWNNAISGYSGTTTNYTLNGGTLDGSNSILTGDERLAYGNLLGQLTMSDNARVVDTRTTSGSWSGNFGLENDVTVTSGTGNLIQAKTLTMPARGKTKLADESRLIVFSISDSAKLTVDGTLAEVADCTDPTAEGVRNLVKNGGGTLSIKAGTYTGYTKIDAGTLQIGSKDAISSSKLWLNGGTLDLSGYDLSVTPYASENAGTLTGKVTNSGNANSTLTLNVATGVTQKLSGVISDGTAALTALTLDGGGTLDVATAQTLTGGVTIKNGTVKITADGGAVVDSCKDGVLKGTVTIEKDGLLQFTKGSAMGYNHSGDNGMPTLIIQGGTVDNTLSTTHNLLWNMTLSDDATVQDATTGRTGWAGNFGLEGKVTVTSGTMNVIRAEKIMLSARYSSTVGTTQFDVQKDACLTLDGNVMKTSSNGAVNPILLKTGMGTLVLTGENNTYTGATTLSAGTLEINTLNNTAQNIQFSTSGITVADDAVLSIRSAEDQTLSLTNITVNDGGLMNLFLTGRSSGGLTLDTLELHDFDSFSIALDGGPVWGAEYAFDASEIRVGGTLITDVADFAKFLTGDAASYLLVSADGAGGFVLATNNAAVPEPSSWFLLLLGVLGLYRLRRRF
ncbi:MAG: autotransporter-associated beta strand repeat-containing protein [Planctomycetia bacterium]|nr:autotransporter-associated beta strand repeat-containing protein [Planctomycetia bacterium]